MSFKIFVASRSFGEYSGSTKKYLEENDCILSWNELGRPYKEEEMLNIIHKYDGIIVGVDTITKEVIKRGINLKVVAKNGVGVDNIDLEAASEAGIFVVNAPGTNSHSVADLAIALMLNLCRKISAIDQMTKRGLWQRRIGRELWQKTVGIIGTGEIGKGVAKRLKGFNCKILAYDINIDKKFAKDYDVNYLQLIEVLKNADFISLHVPLNKHTKYLIDTKELNMMKKTAFLINTSRGGIVNEESLYNALKNNIIEGAASDVFSEEPPGNSPLFSLENFIATSHIGAYTYETNERTGMTVARNIVQGLKGKKPKNLVNKLLIKKNFTNR